MRLLLNVLVLLWPVLLVTAAVLSQPIVQDAQPSSPVTEPPVDTLETMSVNDPVNTCTSTGNASTDCDAPWQGG